MQEAKNYFNAADYVKAYINFKTSEIVLDVSEKQESQIQQRLLNQFAMRYIDSPGFGVSCASLLSLKDIMEEQFQQNNQNYIGSSNPNYISSSANNNAGSTFYQAGGASGHLNQNINSAIIQEQNRNYFPVMDCQGRINSIPSLQMLNLNSQGMLTSEGENFNQELQNNQMNVNQTNIPRAQSFRSVQKNHPGQLLDMSSLQSLHSLEHLYDDERAKNSFENHYNI